MRAYTSAQKGKKILIIDSHPLFREGFMSVIDQGGRFTVAGATGTGTEGYNLAKSLNIDLVVMEIFLPDRDAFQLIRELRSLLPMTPVMILSAYTKIEYIVQALNSGATGYVLKESLWDNLFDGLEFVMKGDYYLDSALSPDLIMELVSVSDKDGTPNNHVNRYLTPREQEIMCMLAEGLSKKKIAEKLFISPRTVENHASNIMNKLSLNSTIELVRCAAKLGLIDMDTWKNKSPTVEFPRLKLVRQV